MNILFLTHTFSDKIIGGEARISWELSRALAKKGLNIFVVSPYVEKKIKRKLPENLKVYKVPFCHLATGLDNSNMLRMFFYSLPLVFLKKIDVIHLASSNGPCPFAKFKFGRPFIESADILHNYDNPKIKKELWYDRKRKREATGIFYKPNFFERIFDKLTDWFYKLFKLYEKYPSGVDLFACRATILIDYLKKQRHKAKLVYIPNGVDVKDFNPKILPILKKNKFTFLFVGKLTKTKGILYLLKAFEKLREEKENIQLFLIGNGAPSTMKEFKLRAKKIQDVHFLGDKSADKIKNYYTSCDVFVMPSLSEGFGISNLEAMACERPVISTKTGGIIDVIVDGETGFLIEPADSDSLYQAMKKMAECPDLVKKMGKKARERVIKNFSWEIIAGKIYQMYKFIV